MSYHEESTTLLTKCRHLYEDVKLFKESKFKKNVYNKINEDINDLNTLLDKLLSNLGDNQNQTDENTLFIANLGSIKLTLNRIKISINPSFRIKDENKWLIMDSFFKNPPVPAVQYRKQISDYLDTLAGSLNLLENFLSTRKANNQLKR